jgi:hypothetical protein
MIPMRNFCIKHNISFMEQYRLNIFPRTFDFRLWVSSRLVDSVSESG